MAVDVGFPTEEPFQELEVTENDMILGSIVFGFFFGFAINVTWTAILETKRAGRFSMYIVMIWLEIFGDVGFGVITWLYLYKVIPPGLGFFASIIICWITQVVCLMLIIVNRLCIIITNAKHRRILRSIVITVLALTSGSTACIWIPAQLQINHQFIDMNHWWDRFEKSVYLCLDLSLNITFIILVKKRLVDHGLKKYHPVMRFNEYIIIISISMDILLLGVTALKNGFVYCQFHPVVYIVKLQIEMTMSRLLIKVARSSGINIYNEGMGETRSGRSDFDGANLGYSRPTRIGVPTISFPIAVQVSTNVVTRNEDDYEMGSPPYKHSTGTQPNQSPAFDPAVV